MALARTRAGDEGSPTVEVWEPFGDRGRTLGSFALSALRFSPDGSVLAVVGPDGITMVDLATGRPIGRIRSGPTTDARFTPDGRAIVAGQGTIWRGPAAWATFGCAIAGGPLSDEEWRELIDPNPKRERACR